MLAPMRKKCGVPSKPKELPSSSNKMNLPDNNVAAENPTSNTSTSSLYSSITSNVHIKKFLENITTTEMLLKESTHPVVIEGFQKCLRIQKDGLVELLKSRLSPNTSIISENGNNNHKRIAEKAQKVAAESTISSTRESSPVIIFSTIHQTPSSSKSPSTTYRTRKRKSNEDVNFSEEEESSPVLSGKKSLIAPNKNASKKAMLLASPKVQQSVEELVTTARHRYETRSLKDQGNTASRKKHLSVEHDDVNTNIASPTANQPFNVVRKIPLNQTSNTSTQNSNKNHATLNASCVGKGKRIKYPHTKNAEALLNEECEVVTLSDSENLEEYGSNQSSSASTNGNTKAPVTTKRISLLNVKDNGNVLTGVDQYGSEHISSNSSERSSSVEDSGSDSGYVADKIDPTEANDKEGEAPSDEESEASTEADVKDPTEASKEEDKAEPDEEIESESEEDDEMCSLSPSARKQVKRILKMDVLGERDENLPHLHLNGIKFSRDRYKIDAVFSKYNCTSCITKRRYNLNKNIKSPHPVDTVYLYKGKIYGNLDYRHICSHLRAERAHPLGISEVEHPVGTKGLQQMADILKLPKIDKNSYTVQNCSVKFEEITFASCGYNKSRKYKILSCRICISLSKSLHASNPGCVYHFGKNLYGDLLMPNGIPHLCMRGLNDSQIQHDKDLLLPQNDAEITVDELMEMLKDPEACYPELGSLLNELQTRCAGNEPYEVYVAFTRNRGTIKEILESIVWIGRANKIQLRARYHKKSGPLQAVVAEHGQLYFAPLLFKDKNFEKCRNLEALLQSLAAMNGFFVKWNDLKNTAIEEVTNDAFRKWMLNKNDKFMVQNDMLVKGLKQMVHAALRIRSNFIKVNSIH